jgi:hypothetical protein
VPVVLGAQESGKPPNIANPAMPGVRSWGGRRPFDDGCRADMDFAFCCGNTSEGLEVPRWFAQLEAKRAAKRNVTFDIGRSAWQPPRPGLGNLRQETKVNFGVMLGHSRRSVAQNRTHAAQTDAPPQQRLPPSGAARGRRDGRS